MGGDALWMVNGTGATYPAIRVGNIGQLSEGGLGGGKLQTLSVTFTLRTSLLDVLGRPYMMSCRVFLIILTEYTDF